MPHRQSHDASRFDPAAIRLLAVINALDANGAAIGLARLCVWLSRAHGWRVTVVAGSIDPGHAAALAAEGVAVTRSTPRAGHDVALLGTVLELAHVQSLASALPVVLCVREGLAPVPRLAADAAMRAAFAACSRVVFLNEWQRSEAYRPLVSSMPSYRLEVVPAGIPTFPDLRKAPVPQGPPTILGVGTLSPLKRPQDLAAAVLAMPRKDVRLRLAGSLKHFDVLSEEARRLLQSAPDRIQLLGTLDPSRLQAEYAAAHVFASTSSDEGMGRSILEAGSAGLPLALSDLPVHAGLWRHGENALMAPVGGVDLLAWNLSILLDDHRLASRLGAAAHRTSALFSESVYWQRMRLILEAAVAEHRVRQMSARSMAHRPPPTAFHPGRVAPTGSSLSAC